MNVTRTLWAAVCALVLGPAVALAQHSSLGYDDLLERLHFAERRIEQLEGHPVIRRLPKSDAPSFPDNRVGAESIAARLTRLELAWAEMSEKELDKEKYVPPKEPTFEWGGRIHFDHWGFPETSPGIGFFENPATGIDPADRFLFRRIRLELEGDIFETMLWRMQIDFNTPGEPEMKDVYIGFQNLPHNQDLLIGNQKRPLGLDHLNSSRFNVFIERPLVVEAFNEDARRPGVCMYGNSDDLQWTWRYGMFLLHNMVTDGEYIGDSLQGSGNARLSWCPWYDECSNGRGYLHLAASGMVARPDGDVDPLQANENEGRFRTRPEARSSTRWIDTGRIPGAQWYEIAGLEAMLNVGPLQIVSEYQNTWMQRDDTTVDAGPDLYFHGAYVYVSYFLTGEYMPYSRKSAILNRVRPFENFFLVETCDGHRGMGLGAWQIAARYSYLDLSDEDIQGGDEQNVTLALNWYWTSHSKVQFNAIWGEIEDHENIGGFTSGDFWIVGTRFMADF